MATVAEVNVRAGRQSELALLGLSIAVICGARALVDIRAGDGLDRAFVIFCVGAVAVALLLNLAVRRFARYADPVLLPAVFTLNGLGLAMLHRIDLANEGRNRETAFGVTQSVWTMLGIGLAIVVIMVLRDHRMLRRYTYTAGLAGVLLLMLPLVPGLGVEINGARIWINIGGYSLQPGEFAKIALVIFFAGYLVTNRDALALAGPKVLGIRLPRPRDMGPLVLVWIASLVLQVYERDLGASLLFFGIFLGMIYIATERVSWIITGLSLFLVGATIAGSIFPHVQRRYHAWLTAMEADTYSSGQSQQLVRGLFGMGSGGLFGTGLGEGYPTLVPLPESDFIFTAFGEELGLTGLMAILTLYLLIAQRAMRTAIGTRDGFGKLVAAGLGFTLTVQVFVVVGGVTRLIPLTGLTLPFMAYGGSSMIANWVVMALLIRISDHARRPGEGTA